MSDKSVTFPIMTSKSGRFLTMNGDFFIKVGEGKAHHWRKLELYLPASPAIYKMNSLEEVAELRFSRLESGETPIKQGLKGNGAIDSRKYKFGFK